VVDIPRVVTAALEAGYTGPFGVAAFTRDVLTSEASSALAIWRSPIPTVPPSSPTPPG
jgi:D-psicose/D-tagatose/L-ribulose 3-epimerase